MQLGPASSTRPHDARIFTVPVQADDILILASDGLSDNLWDAEILDEVVRFRRSFMGPSASDSDSDSDGKVGSTSPPAGVASTTLRRSTLAGMLSEALCSRAKRVSETRRSSKAAGEKKGVLTSAESGPAQAEAEVPFAKRAKEQGEAVPGRQA